MSLRIIVFAIVLASMHFSLQSQGFREEQMKYGRVKKAYAEKGRLIRSMILDSGLDSAGFNLFIRVFKEEHIMEIWACDSLAEKYVLLNTYHICRVSGKAGPKRKQGDLQVPEGCYFIDRFNPWSHFHLSMGIDYPNASDLKLTDSRHPGGEIFIHGACVTIGCLPMTDDRIKEIYILAVEARNNGQEEIPIHIFPCRMSGEYYKSLKAEHASDTGLIDFWINLEEAFYYFEMNRELPEFTIDREGRYCFQ